MKKQINPLTISRINDIYSNRYSHNIEAMAKYYEKQLHEARPGKRRSSKELDMIREFVHELCKQQVDIHSPAQRLAVTSEVSSTFCHNDEDLATDALLFDASVAERLREL